MANEKVKERVNWPVTILLIIGLITIYAGLKNLFDRALSSNVVLVSATTLLATMRTVSFIWRQENQKNNVIAIANESGKLYDKFVGFSEDLNRIGKAIDTSLAAYHAAMNKLSDSTRYGDTIMGRIENLKRLGANASK